ncbi:MAG: dGTP triphosphohydrolase [Aminipila sp.]
MRDRDRVLYSAPFRLLAGKTQVYITGIDDNMRTRLTHTLEVAQIAKTIATALRLDVDLAEAIALGHDIGHTPYGHAGERILHDIMNPKHDHPIKGSPFDLKNIGEIEDFIRIHTDELGFKHNLHSVEVALSEAERTENQSLSLTNYTLYGMCAHSSFTYKDKDEGKLGYYGQFREFYRLNDHDAWSFEAYVVEEADEIAQRHHDLEDAIRGNLLSTKVVYEQIKHCFKEFFNRNDKRMLNSMKSLLNENQSLYYAKLSKLIVNMLVTRLIKCSIHNLNQFIEDNKITEAKFREHIRSSDGKQERSLISYDFLSDDDRPFYTRLNSFKTAVSNQVLGAYDIQRADAKGKYIIRKITQALYSNPKQLPNECLVDYCTTVYKMKYE